MLHKEASQPDHTAVKNTSVLDTQESRGRRLRTRSGNGIGRLSGCGGIIDVDGDCRICD